MIRVRFELGSTPIVGGERPRLAILERVAHQHDERALHVASLYPEEWIQLLAFVVRDDATIDGLMRARVAAFLRDLAAQLAP